MVSAESALPEVVGDTRGPACRASYLAAGVCALLARPERARRAQRLGPGPSGPVTGSTAVRGFLAVHAAVKQGAVKQGALDGAAGLREVGRQC